jgi:hypothetical protein
MRITPGLTHHRYEFPTLRRVRSVKEPDNKSTLGRNNCCELKTGAQAPIDPAKREPPCCIDGSESFGAMAIMTGTLVPHAQGIGAPKPRWLL